MSSVTATGTMLTADQQGERPMDQPCGLTTRELTSGATHMHTAGHRPTSVEAES